MVFPGQLLQLRLCPPFPIDPIQVQSRAQIHDQSERISGAVKQRLAKDSVVSLWDIECGLFDRLAELVDIHIGRGIPRHARYSSCIFCWECLRGMPDMSSSVMMLKVIEDANWKRIEWIDLKDKLCVERERMKRGEMQTNKEKYVIEGSWINGRRYPCFRADVWLKLAKVLGYFFEKPSKCSMGFLSKVAFYCSALA